MTRVRPNDVLADLLRENAELRAEIERLREENSCLVSERIENEAKIERLTAALKEVAKIGDTANPASALARHALENKP